MCDHVAVLALAAVYVNSLNTKQQLQNATTLRGGDGGIGIGMSENAKGEKHNATQMKMIAMR